MCDDGDQVDNACSLDCHSQEVLSLSVGWTHGCALLTGGVVKCWGYNQFGTLGLGDTKTRGDQPGEMGDALPPTDLGNDQVAVALAAGTNYTCALLAGGAVKCWGWNSVGALGLGDTENRGDEPNEMGDNLPTVDLGAGVQATP